ncbi:MAG: Hsp70 family protein, partial [Planctomycetes bacterium]|nr:Hsp70 family protein [Planctomycetota bacterium]
IFARDRGAEVPARFVSSVKSWLCQSGVDRKKNFLPFQSEEDLTKISPFSVTKHYLNYIAHSWQQSMECPLSEQEITLTVPASFDEEARKLTEEAAREVGFQKLTILEEPQAALYSWVAAQGEEWRKEVEEDDVILVCDIGGGTSDFSLITVVNKDGNLALERSAVGEHILLGGDNMDLALAYQAKARMESKKKLTSWQLRSLWFKARQIKEKLLSGEDDKAQFTVLGTGIKKLIGGTLKAEFSAKEVQSILVDGFFPKCSIEDHPKEAKAAGLQEIGLNYASDASITKHLAKFLSRQSESESFKWPTKILFNGGVFNCDNMRERCIEVINSWLSEVGEKEVSCLNHRSLDNAVALGASYYSSARQGKGIRIRAGIPRSYYIQVESAMPAIPGMEAPQKAVCIAPFGMEEGTSDSLKSETFALTTGIPASFQFLSSTIRQEDGVGQILEDWDEEELELTSPMDVTLENSEGLANPVPVNIGAAVTEVGTLELFFTHTESERRWKLEYNVRDDS